MSRLRFWQKTYLLTLALFLVALFGGVALIGWQNQQQTMDREVENACSEQRFVTQSLARDLATLDSSNTRLHAASLARSYGEHYAQNNVLLLIGQGEEVLYTDVPVAAGPDGTVEVRPGMQSWTTRTLDDGNRYLLVASELTEGVEGYTLTYARSMEPLLSSWSEMHLTLIAGCALISIVLACGLFFILRSLSKPLERLAGVADEFAAGDFEVRAKKHSNDEIGMLADSFNAMANTAEHNIAEIQHSADQNARMAANLSHEVRSPLTAIRGYAEYLQLADPTPDEQASALAYIVEESGRLQTISQRMLQLAVLDHDAFDFTAVSLADVVAHACQSLEPAAHEGDVALDFTVAPHLTIKGDAVLLESLVSNLLDNALHASLPGGTVLVTASNTSSAIVLNVSDTGRGLAPDELRRLGEPFYRPDKARSRAAGGAGLGVALCFQIAELHGATLTYTSAEGKGTTATLVFTTL